jgi:hypothetical protein
MPARKSKGSPPREDPCSPRTTGIVILTIQGSCRHEIASSRVAIMANAISREDACHEELGQSLRSKGTVTEGGDGSRPHG